MQVWRKIAFPISLVYGLVVYLRNYFYDIGFFSSRSFSTFTICVGNLSVGGTGKTPMIEFLIARLQPKYKLAIVSRGYKRKSEGFILANEHTKVEEIGDEPFQIQAKFPEVVVAVDADRRNAISILEARLHPELILLDDAFQHRKVKSSFSVLLTAYPKLYVDDWYLPTGNLRDSSIAAKRAHVIVVTKCPEHLDIKEQHRMRQRLHPEPYQKVVFSTLYYKTQLQGYATPLHLADLKGKSVCVVTGIAHAGHLITFLVQQELIVEHLKYADHHFFTDQEIALFKTKEIILTTEKDYVRLKNNLQNVAYIQIEHRFLGDGEVQLMNALREAMP
jgi:tetraacyldisaccharide 4'-kinase